MRSGSYDPGRSNIDITMQMEGFYGPDRDDAESEAERKAQRDADQQFRAVIEKAIADYGNRESEWQRPTCADLKFNPEKNRLTLSPNASGNYERHGDRQVRRQPVQSWTRACPDETENAVFSPTRAGGQRAQFEYSRVSPAVAPGAKVRAKVRATSKAGVAEDAWEQPIKPPFEIDEIAGNFSGSYTRAYSMAPQYATWTPAAPSCADAGVAAPPGADIIKAGIAASATGPSITTRRGWRHERERGGRPFQDGGGSMA